MKRLFRFVLPLAALAVIGWALFGPAVKDTVAERIDYVSVDGLNDAPRGYSDAIVCSSFVNNTNAHGAAEYQDVSAPTGKYFDYILAGGGIPGAAQVFTIRFWLTSTDSTSIYDGAITVNLPSTTPDWVAFPVRCVKMSLTGVTATDDFYIIGFCKDE